MAGTDWPRLQGKEADRVPFKFPELNVTLWIRIRDAARTAQQVENPTIAKSEEPKSYAGAGKPTLEEMSRYVDEHFIGCQYPSHERL